MFHNKKQMKYSKQLTLLLFSLFLSILIVANYLFYIKLTEQNQIDIETIQNKSIEEKIIFFSQNLPLAYSKPKLDIDNVTQIFIRNVKKYYELDNFTYVWKLSNSWVSKRQIVNPVHEEIGKVYGALKHAPIIRADLDGRGSQLKFLFTLQGNQDVIFKPKRYEKQKILEGPVYGGKDRHTSEIVAFYLSIILNQPFAPFSVERKVFLKNEIMPVASKRFLDTTIIISNRTCVYGKCYYCSKTDAICADKYDTLTGAVIFNINSNFKIITSPWKRNYKNAKKTQWEQDESYCKIVRSSITQTRLLEMIDFAIFDFFIQNGDRHHYEMMGDKLLLLDNGKGLGNPYKHHIDILAPLYQCCMLRKKTWKKLLSLGGGKLSSYLKQMPDINSFLFEDHLQAIDGRLSLVYAVVEYCKNEDKMIFI